MLQCPAADAAAFFRWRYPQRLYPALRGMVPDIPVILLYPSQRVTGNLCQVIRYCFGVLALLRLFTYYSPRKLASSRRTHSQAFNTIRWCFSREERITRQVLYTPPRPDSLSPTLSAGADWAVNITDRVPILSFAEDGTAYNSNLPSLTEGWW